MPDLRVTPLPRLDSSFLKIAAGVGVATNIGAWALQGAMMTIRWSLEEHGGVGWTGQFQASNSIGSTYFGIVVTSLGSVVFPRYAAAQTSEALTKEYREAYSFVLRMLPPVIFMAIAFRKLVIVTLYSHRFDGAIAVLGIQMIADIIRGACWVQWGFLLARLKWQAYLVLETTTCALIGITAIVLIPRLGLVGAAYGFLVGYTYNLFLSAWLNTRAFGLPINFRGISTTLGYAATAGLVLAVTTRWPWTSWLTAAGVGVWAWKVGLLAAGVDRLVPRVRRARAWIRGTAAGA